MGGPRISDPCGAGIQQFHVELGPSRAQRAGILVECGPVGPEGQGTQGAVNLLRCGSVWSHEELGPGEDRGAENLVAHGSTQSHVEQGPGRTGGPGRSGSVGLLGWDLAGRLFF
jgi:hypothetical protein